MTTSRENLIACISDASKEAQGFRVRDDFTTYTDAELRAELSEWQRWAEVTADIYDAEDQVQAWEDAESAELAEVSRSHYCDVADALEA